MRRLSSILVMMAVALMAGSGVAVAACPQEERTVNNRSPKADNKRREKRENEYTTR
jgi:hypothetical protein